MITSLPALFSLEINGHSSGSFDASLLPHLAQSSGHTNQSDGPSDEEARPRHSSACDPRQRRRRRLRELKLILPDRAVMDALLPLVQGLAVEDGEESGLAGFEIISQVSSCLR